MKILIADDDLVSRRLLQMTLIKWGYDVVTANNGSDAWEILQSENAPLLTILDWMMPGLNGNEICRQVRQTPLLAPIYIILLTSKGDREDIVAAYCKNIRNDENYWQQIEGYIEAHSEALFTHSICPNCYQKHIEPELETLRQRRGLA